MGDITDLGLESLLAKKPVDPNKHSRMSDKLNYFLC